MKIFRLNPYGLLTIALVPFLIYYFSFHRLQISTPKKESSQKVKDKNLPFIVFNDKLIEHKFQNEVMVLKSPESLFARVNEVMEFHYGSTALNDVDILVFDKLVSLLKDDGWFILIEGHAEADEISLKDNRIDPRGLSADRAHAVSEAMIKRGVDPKKITTMFFGDSHPKEKSSAQILDRRVEFILKRSNLRDEGQKLEF